MREREHSEPIKLYLDDATEPFKISPAPLTFQFNTIALPDGPHRLRIEASNGLAPPTVKEIPFTVRNGVAITVSGLEREQTIAGQVHMVINAYAGSTEIDFEPSRAETPQPIPTWAYVVLLAVVAWTLYYVMTPHVHSSAAVERARLPSSEEGNRIYSDTCARCHGEAARGLPPKIPPLLDAQIALAPTPAPLLMKVTASTPGSMMPDWGTRMTNEEIVSVVNHVRHSWGHDSSEIRLRHRNPPEGIDVLHRQISKALKARDLPGLMLCCADDGGLQPQIFRTDGVDQRGAAAVQSAWANYFAALRESRARVAKITLPDARYDYEPATVEQDGSVVIATGRIFLETRNDQGRSDVAKGRFIRIYQLVSGAWRMVFDFADIPMAVGCVPGTVICPPDGGGPDVPDSAPGALPGDDAATPPPPVPPPGTTVDVEAIGYAEVQQYLEDLGREVRTAPHMTFWELPYEEFVRLEFPVDWGEDAVYHNLVVGNSEASNLIKALRDGKGIVVHHPNGTTTVNDNLGRMPKGGPYMPAERIARIAAWIDAGCPEVAGGPPAKPGAAPEAPVVPVAPPAPVPGFPPPSPGGNAPAPGGFPPPSPPKDAPAPGGFPPPSPPKDAPAPGGFPPPAPVPQDPPKAPEKAPGVPPEAPPVPPAPTGR